MPQITVGGDKSRLLLLIPELQMGGAARAVRDQARALAPYFPLREVVFDESHGVDFAGEQQVISLDDRERRGPFRPLANLARRSLRLRRVKAALSAELTISHLDGGHRVNILSGGPDAKVLVVHGSLAHDRTLRGVRRAAARALIPLLYNRADRIVTVCRDLVDELASLGVARSKMITINNIVDVDGVAAEARAAIPEAEQAIFRDSPAIAMIGRLHEQKNPLRLLDVFAGLLRRTPTKLVVVGDGPLRDQAVARAEALGLRTYSAWRDSRIERGRDAYFLGQKANPFPYLAAARLFVLPSLWEGFPLSLCEALACGTPSLAADCPTGPREILAPASARPEAPIVRPEPGCGGVLMPLLDNAAGVEVWVKALAGLLGDEADRGRLSRSGRLRALDFSAARILPQWLELIGGLVGGQ